MRVDSALSHAEPLYRVPSIQNDISQGYHAHSNLGRSDTNDFSPIKSPYARNLPLQHSQQTSLLDSVAGSASALIRQHLQSSAPQKELDEHWTPVSRSRTISRSDNLHPFHPPMHSNNVNGNFGRSELSESRNEHFLNSSRYKPRIEKKPVYVNSDLVDKFIRLAEHATSRNRETMGILAGKTTSLDGYIVTHLIIPDQTGTHDSCETLDYENLAKEMIQEDLTQLGWIHVHPKFEVFLSSVDMHTQLVPQQQLPEYFAIVWSPVGNPQLGVFNLTDHGLDVLSNCDKGHGFHEHDSDGPLFEDSTHVTLSQEGIKPTQIIDLRR